MSKATTAFGRCTAAVQHTALSHFFKCSCNNTSTKHHHHQTALIKYSVWRGLSLLQPFCGWEMGERVYFFLLEERSQMTLRSGLYVKTTTLCEVQKGHYCVFSQCCLVNEPMRAAVWQEHLHRTKKSHQDVKSSASARFMHPKTLHYRYKRWKQPSWVLSLQISLSTMAMRARRRSKQPPTWQRKQTEVGWSLPFQLLSFCWDLFKSWSNKTTFWLASKISRSNS